MNYEVWVVWYRSSSEVGRLLYEVRESGAQFN